MAISPDGKILINTSETTNMAHFIDTRDAPDRRECAGDARRASPNSNATAANCGYRRRSEAPLSVIDPVKRAGYGKITFNIPGCAEAIQPSASA